MDLIKLYHNKENSIDWFPNYLRVYLEWDDNRYLEMIGIINSILNEYKDSLVVPKLLVIFFFYEIDHIIGTASHHNFTNLNIPIIKSATDRNTYKELIEKRIMELKEMRQEFIGNYCCDYLMIDDNKQQTD